MVSKAQKKMNKKKAREKENKKKVLLKREQHRSKAQQERKEKRKDKKIKKLQKDMGDLDIWADEVYKNVSDDALNQLEHNAKILKVLEDEAEKENEEKRVRNEELEEKGHKTLDEKLQRLVSQSDQHEMRSNVLMAPKQARDVSDVELIKAKPKES